MARFDSQQTTAQRLIALNGEDVTLRVYSSTTPDPSKPWNSGDSAVTTVSAKAVFLNYTTQQAGQTYTDGTEIHRTDKKVLVAALGLSDDPNLQGTVVRADGTVFRIIKVKLLDPNGQKILFELQARR